MTEIRIHDKREASLVWGIYTQKVLDVVKEDIRVLDVIGDTEGRESDPLRRPVSGAAARRGRKEIQEELARHVEFRDERMEM